MKSKVILFCVLLFCSKFVESIPFSEEHAIQRAYQPSTWPETQNAPRNHPNTFARTQTVNSARQNDNTQEYYQNQGRLNDESYGYKNNPTLITSEKEAFVDYDSSADGQRLNSYPTRVDYPRRIDTSHDQFENKNWQSHNQYINTAENGGNVAIKEQPLLTTVRNPYQGPVQYQLPKFTSSSNRQHYNDEGYKPREQYYQEQQLPGPSSSITFVKDNDADDAITNDAKSGGPRYLERLQGGNYNGVPTLNGDVSAHKFGHKKYVDTSDVTYPLAEKSENIRLVNNYRLSQDQIRNSNQVPINTAPVNINNNDGSLRMADAVVEESENRRFNNMNNYRLRPVPINNLPIKPINNYNVALPDVVGEKSGNRYVNDGQSDVTLVEKSRNNRYGPNYARQSNPVKNVPWNNNDGSADKIDTVLEKSGNGGYYVSGHGSDAGSKKLPTVIDYNSKNDAPLTDVLAEKTGKSRFIDNSGSYFETPKPVITNKKTEIPETLIDTVKINPNNNKPSGSYKLRNGPRNPEPVDRNLDHNNQHLKKIQSFSVKDLLSKANIQSILSGNSKRFVIVHPNNTVEYKDKLDFSTEDNKKYRMLNANQFNEAYGVSNGNGTYSTQPPVNIAASSTSAAPPVPVDGHTLSPDFKEQESNNKSRPLVPSKTDDHLSVSTLTPIVPYNNTTPIPLLLTTQDDKNNQKPTTYSPPVTTTATPDNSSQIITISPIELATDNVTDISQVTETTESPLTTTVTLDTVTYAYNKQDNAYNGTNLTSSVASTLDLTEKLSTTTVSPSNSVSVTKDELGSGIVIEIMTKANGTQNNETIIVNEGNNKYNGTQTAMNSSLTNSDVPTKRDDNSPVTTVLSIQNDVNTGETSTTDDNTLEYKQSETDIIITLSTNYDSEDEIIALSIEVSESTDDEDSSNKDVMLVKIPTKTDNKVDSKPLNTDACEKDCNNESNNDTNTGKNVEIDLKNINGEPIMWVKTTNEDIMQKLISKNDTSFDVIYFFNVQNKTIIEKDKHTTIFCNGTVVIDQTETTWQYENDPSPKVEKTSKTIDIKDYKP